MATSTNESGAAGGTGGGNKIVPLVIVAVVAAVVGSASGAFVAAPLVAKKIANAAPVAHAAQPEGGEQEKAKAQGPTATYTIDNLVLNPAGSGGTRFLMTTVAFGVTDEPAVEQMKGRDAEVRDALLRILGTKTVEQLADISQRGALKEETKSAVGALFDEGVVHDVYFPQFVIQ